MSSTLTKTDFGKQLNEEGLGELRQYEFEEVKHPSVWDSLINLDKFSKIEPYGDRHKEARVWYPYMPAFGSPDLPGFLVSSRELVLYVADDKRITLRVENSPSAYADQKNFRIGLPAHIFGSPGFGGHGDDYPNSVLTEMAVATMNGLLLHEAAHFAKTLPTITDMFLASDNKAWLDKAHAAVTVFNVTEDMYIEDWLRGTFPSYIPFIEASQNYYFHDVELARRIIQTYESAEIDEDNWKLNGGAFIDLLIMIKNWRLQDLDIWGPHIFEYAELLLEFRDMHDHKTRAMASNTFTRKIMLDPRLNWAAPDGPNTENNNGDVGEEGTGITILRVTQSELEDESATALTKKEIKEIEEAFKKDEVIILVESDRHEVSEIPEAKVQRPEESIGRQVRPDPKFSKLGLMLRRSLTSNLTPGEPMRRGQVLVGSRLYRIATDNKIFAYREKRQATGKDYEIGILVDCSGSMSGEKITQAMSVGVASWLSLRSARIRTTLMGHSTASDMVEYPVLYIIGLPNEATGNVIRRASSFTGGRAMLRNNIDGYALLGASKQFSDRPTRKWLFHISDGQPAGHSYSGDAAIAHTSVVANRIRKRGIDVVSITIDSGAWEVNDRIYGENKNVKTSSPRVLMELIEAMFKKGAKDVEVSYKKGS